MSGPEREAPRERLLTADHPVVRSVVGSLGLLIVLLAVTAIGAAAFGRDVSIVFLIDVVAVVAIGIFIGNSGVLTLGHVAFMGIAAYTSSLLTMDPTIKSVALPDLPSWLASVHLSLPVATVVTIVVVAAIAAVVGLPISRLPGYSAAIASLGLLIVVNVLLLGVTRFTHGAQTFYGVDPLTTLAVAIVGAFLAILVARLFRDSLTGLKLRSSREDETAARSSGVNIERLRLASWVLSAAIAALAGVLLAHYLTAFSPRQFYFTQTFALLAMLIVGGATTVTGAVGGAALITLLTQLLLELESNFSFAGHPLFGLSQVGVGLALIGVMYFRRDGLFGRRELDEFVLFHLTRSKKHE